MGALGEKGGPRFVEAEEELGALAERDLYQGRGGGWVAVAAA